MCSHLAFFCGCLILQTLADVHTLPSDNPKNSTVIFSYVAQLHAKYWMPINHSGFLPPFLVCLDAVSTRLGKTQGGSRTSRSDFGTSMSHVLFLIGKQPLNCLDGRVGKAKLNQNLRKLIVFATGGRFYGSWLVEITVYGSFLMSRWERGEEKKNNTQRKTTAMPANLSVPGWRVLRGSEWEELMFYKMTRWSAPT